MGTCATGPRPGGRGGRAVPRRGRRPGGAAAGGSGGEEGGLGPAHPARPAVRRSETAVLARDLPLLRLPQGDPAEPEPAYAYGRAHQHRPEPRAGAAVVPGLPRHLQPGQAAAGERGADPPRGVVPAVRTVPRGQVPRLEGGRPREADRDVERGEAVPPLRPLPQPARPGVQAASADAAADAPGEPTVTEPRKQTRAAGEDSMPRRETRDDHAF